LQLTEILLMFFWKQRSTSGLSGGRLPAFLVAGSAVLLAGPALAQRDDPNLKKYCTGDYMTMASRIVREWSADGVKRARWQEPGGSNAPASGEAGRVMAAPRPDPRLPAATPMTVARTPHPAG
jgi:hypothetical protein